MTLKKQLLAFSFYVRMVMLVTYTTGEVTPPWITLLGCFSAENEPEGIPLPNSTSTTCFKICNDTSDIVGVQDNHCTCFKGLKRISDVQNAQRFSYSKCSKGDKGFIFLYAKVSVLPNAINAEADYGYVYVNISSSSLYTFHASLDPTEKHNFICYDNSKQCIYRTSGIDRNPLLYARKQCDLVSYFDFKTSCLDSTIIKIGEFWIWMDRDSSGFSVSVSTSSTKTSEITSLSTLTSMISQLTTLTSRISQLTKLMSRISQLTTNTPTALTTDTGETQSTTYLKVETIATTPLPFPTESSASTEKFGRTWTTVAAEKSERSWMTVAAVFISISCVLMAVIAGLVYLRIKKENQIRHNDEENTINHKRTSIPHAQEIILNQDTASALHTVQEMDQNLATPSAHDQGIPNDSGPHRKNKRKHKKHKKQTLYTPMEEENSRREQHRESHHQSEKDNTKEVDNEKKKKKKEKKHKKKEKKEKKHKKKKKRSHSRAEFDEDAS